MLKADEYYLIILKTLQTSAKQHSGSPEELARHLVARMSDFAEMFDLASDFLITPPATLRSPDLPPTAPAPADPDQAPDPHPHPGVVTLVARDLGERIGQPSPAEPEQYSADELQRHYEDILPLELAVQPPGFAEPLMLRRALRRAEFGGFLRIHYVAPGHDLETASAQMVVTLPYGADWILSQIRSAAAQLYRAAPAPVVMPHIPAHANSFSELLSGAASAETDAQANVEDIQQWRRNEKFANSAVSDALEGGKY